MTPRALPTSLLTLAGLVLLTGCAGTPPADPASVTVTEDGSCPTCGRGPIVLIPGSSLPDGPAAEPAGIPIIWTDEGCIWPSPALEPAPPPEALPEDEARRKASVDGRYTELLRRIEVPDDHTIYGSFHDYGPWSGTAWGGHTDLPPGRWVYVYPHWYIWK